MEQRPFGRTGLDVGAIGYGCWEIGGGYGDVEVEDFERAVDATKQWWSPSSA
jgi:aryl-alcohol dehydrogenase-like predicted oxidoreductase